MSLLLGTWQVRATNIPLWLSNERVAPAIAFELISDAPLVLGDDVSWHSSDGRREHQLGVDRWNGSDFARRGLGRRRLRRSQWSVVGSSADRDILVLRLTGSRSTPPGLDVFVRAGAEIGDARTLVAHSATALGLSAEDFASLTWLDRP
ncbi:hypothetical protein [Marisediminicola antarctica]|uniref:hypothetical protein n=1 Tax=Marisediminicola antarctica TaxID=674079 RepID=UPI00137B47A4|nr:hypothetical protein [Marisediminicola antarctica]